MKRIPREAQSRLQALVVLSIDSMDVGFNPSERTGCGIKNDESVVTFGWHRVPLVPQAQFESKVRCPLVVVLHKKAARALSDAAGLIAEGYTERVGRPVDKGVDCRKIERASALPEDIVEELPVLAADFYGMSSAQAAHRVRRNKHRVTAARRVVRRPPEAETAGNRDLWEPDRFINAVNYADLCRIDLYRRSIVAENAVEAES